MVVPRSIRLHISALTPDTWVRLTRETEGRYYRFGSLLRQLRVLPQAVFLELRDSAGLIHWEPGADEIPWVGRVFAALLKELYSEKRWRMNVWLFAPRVPVGEEYEGRWRQGLHQYAKRRGLSSAFEVVVPAREHPGVQYTTRYWWCPKASLPSLLEETYSDHSEGQVAPWPDRGELERCVARQQRPARFLNSLLSTCRFHFQGYNRGEAMILLSRQVQLAEVEAAAQRPAVQTALCALSRKARFVEWTVSAEESDGEVYEVHSKP